MTCWLFPRCFYCVLLLWHHSHTTLNEPSHEHFSRLGGIWISSTLSLQPVETVRLLSFVKCSECGRVLTKNAIRYVKKRYQNHLIKRRCYELVPLCPHCSEKSWAKGSKLVLIQRKHLPMLGHSFCHRFSGYCFRICHCLVRNRRDKRIGWEARNIFQKLLGCRLGRVNIDLWLDYRHLALAENMVRAGTICCGVHFLLGQANRSMLHWTLINVWVPKGKILLAFWRSIRDS